MPVVYFDGERGHPGALITGTDSGGNAKRYVIPAFVQTDSAGTEVGAGTSASPNITRQAQNAETSTKVTLAAATAATILAAGQTNGARVLNWTAAAVYIVPGTSGTPASGAPSDYIPAAASGVPGQWEASYAPTLGLRAVGASAGDLTVVTF